MIKITKIHMKAQDLWRDIIRISQKWGHVIRFLNMKNHMIVLLLDMKLQVLMIRK